MEYILLATILLLLYGAPIWIAVQNGRSLIGWTLMTVLLSPIVSLIVLGFLYGNGALKAHSAV